MNLIESPNRHFPKNWSETSLDFKSLFIYFGCTGLLWIVGSSLSIKALLLIELLLVVIWITISIYHRRLKKWRWPGANGKNLLQSLLVLILGGGFLFATLSMWSFTDAPAWWYMGVSGITIFNILHYLNFIDLSEQDFRNNCNGKIRPISETQSKSSAMKTSGWESKIKMIYSVVFIIVWLEFMIFMYYFNTAYNNGSPVPTTYQTEALSQHSHTVYITSSEKNIVDVLQIFMFVGMPSVLISGFWLQKKRINIFSPTKRKTNSNSRQKKRG